jgi:hypothetical protein
MRGDERAMRSMRHERLYGVLEAENDFGVTRGGLT